MNESTSPQDLALGLLGATVGGCVGYFAFVWIASQGFYALMLPPGLLGIGAGLASRRRSRPLAIICAVAGFVLGLFTEWRHAPFTWEKSFGYFLTHVHQLQPVTLIMIAVGTYLAYSLAFGRERRTSD